MKKSESPKTIRRPRGRARAKRELVRGEPIVQRVLAATVEELARVGYGALRVEDVAARADVNKTTVYRRWPEKNALVRDALGCVGASKFAPPETGSLRGDLLAMGRALVDLSSSPHGQSLVRMLVAEGAHGELAEIKRSLRRDREVIPLSVISGAVARGELAPRGDHRLGLDALVATLHHRIFFQNEAVTGAYLERLVDLLLNGMRCAPPSGDGPKGKARGRDRAAP